MWALRRSCQGLPQPPPPSATISGIFISDVVGTLFLALEPLDGGPGDKGDEDKLVWYLFINKAIESNYSSAYFSFSNMAY